MFTGIIQSIGFVTSTTNNSDGVRLSVNLNRLNLERVKHGDSVAVNGVCLTVISIKDGVADFDVSKETLEKCLIGNWGVGCQVNLELALTLETPIGGHLVSGHVDGTATLTDRQDSNDFTVMQFKTDLEIGKFIAIKGSVAVDGISLTTNKINDHKNHTYFDVMLVPHTLQNTTLGELTRDEPVHIEIDQIARYVHRIHTASVS